MKLMSAKSNDVPLRVQCLYALLYIGAVYCALWMQGELDLIFGVMIAAPLMVLTTIICPATSTLRTLSRSRRISRSLMERVCTSDEFYTVNRSIDPTMAFLQLWTRKEAVLKCRGTGIKGFESMVHALESDDVEVIDLPCDLPDTVAALAVIKAG